MGALILATKRTQRVEEAPPNSEKEKLNLKKRGLEREARTKGLTPNYILHVDLRDQRFPTGSTVQTRLSCSLFRRGYDRSKGLPPGSSPCRRSMLWRPRQKEGNKLPRYSKSPSHRNRCASAAHSIAP